MRYGKTCHETPRFPAFSTNGKYGNVKSLEHDRSQRRDARQREKRAAEKVEKDANLADESSQVRVRLLNSIATRAPQMKGQHGIQPARKQAYEIAAQSMAEQARALRAQQQVSVLVNRELNRKVKHEAPGTVCDSCNSIPSTNSSIKRQRQDTSDKITLVTSPHR